MEKNAASAGIGVGAFKAQELQAIQRWQSDKNPQDFEFLYGNHQKMIDRAGNRYLRSAQLPKAAVRSDMLRQYISALRTFKPDKGAALSTHVNTHMQHTGRFLQKYQNIGKISSTRTARIGEFKRIDAELSAKLGRMPSASEIADEMLLPKREVETLRRELRKDKMSEGIGSQQVLEDSRIKDRLYFTYNSLDPEQQSVLEYTEGMFGRPAFGRDAEKIGEKLNMSPQKVRSIKKQIWRRVEKYF